MAVSMAGFSVNDALTKYLVTQMNVAQVMLLRGIFAVFLIGALAYHQRALRALRIWLVRPVAVRMIGEIGGTTTFLISLAHLPLANTSAIFQSLPLAITLGAAVIFGEQVGWRRWSAIVAGFTGVLIVVRPGVAGFNQVSLLVITSVAFCALRDLVTKQIPPDVPSLLVTLLTNLAVTVVGAILLVPFGGWTSPSLSSLGLLATAAALVLIGYQCVIMALRIGDISAIAPMRYSQLIWAMLLGYLAFGDVPDGAMILGALVIVASGLYAFHRERMSDRLRPASVPGLPPEGL